MCSEFFRIPLDWLNQPLAGGLSLGTGLALLLALVGIALIAWLRSSGRRDDAWAYLPSLLCIAAAIALVPRMFPAGLPVRGYGMMVLLGAITGMGMATVRARQMGLSTDVLYTLAFAMFVCGIIGARLFFVIEYWETRFRSDDWRTTLLEVVKFTEGGLVVYGSLIGATLAFLYVTTRHRLPPLAVADLIAPSLLAGLALGRLGCLLNGCCFGGETTLPWAVTFPAESPVYQEQASTGRLWGIALAPSDEHDHRLAVLSVEADSPAADAGLVEGTVVAKINGYSVRDLSEAQSALLATWGTAEPLRLTTEGGDEVRLSTDSWPERSRPVHPTQIYSAVQAALLSWVLWSYYPFRRRDGEVTALMLTVYPIARFLLEIIRVDESAIFGTGLSISQNVSLLLLGGAVVLWIYLSRQPRQLATFAQPSS